MRLVEADGANTGSGHLAHHLVDVILAGARVRGADSDGAVVRDHLGEDVKDGLLVLLATS